MPRKKAEATHPAEEKPGDSTPAPDSKPRPRRSKKTTAEDAPAATVKQFRPKKVEDSPPEVKSAATGAVFRQKAEKPTRRPVAKERKKPDSRPAASETSPSGIQVVFRDVGEVSDVAAKRTDAKPTRPKRSREKEPPVRETRRRSAPTRASETPLPKPQFDPFMPDLSAIPTPDGAPRVVRINGRPTIIVGKEVVPPIGFFGNPSDEKRSATVMEQIRRAASAGVHLHSLMVEFPVDEEEARNAFDLSAFLLQQALEADPQARVIFRIVFAGASGWERKYPDATFRYEDGAAAEPSVCDEAFWGEAQRLLGAYVRGLRSLPNGERILGIHLDRGEWFLAQGWGYDTSRAAENAFRNWTRDRYAGDVIGLQAAWFDGRAKFETVRTPEFNAQPLSGDNFLRASRKERRWVDYHLFLSDAMVARIHRLAWETKRSSDGNFLVAVSYGYTFEWSHPASGHLSLGKLLRCREIDIIGGPPSYRDRQMGGVCSFPGPIDSFALNGKLYISEEDFKTPMGSSSEPDDFNPLMATPQALEAAHWRGLGCALTRGSGISWMDLWGNGWLNTPAIWSRASQVRASLLRGLAEPLQDPDVAVLIDERSLAYLSDARAFQQLIQDSREAVLRAGVSAGFYLLSDLAHRLRFPDAKLYIFLNAWDMRPEVRAAIKTRLQRDGKTLFWVYAAGLFESGRHALERVREVTGIAIRPQPFSSRAGTTILNRKHQLTELLEERALSIVDQLEPSYFAIPEEGCVVLGEYSQTGLPSLVVREIHVDGDPTQSWRSVFLAEPMVSEKIIRGLCQLAGVQIWNYHGDAVNVRKPFLSIHYTGSGHRTATLPDRWHAYDVGSEKMVGLDATHIKSQASDGATQVLIVGEEADVEKLASLDVEPLLTLSELPEPEPDTVEDTDVALDLPLLGLTEPDELFMLLGEASQAADDAIEDEAAASRKPQARRRKEPDKKPAPKVKKKPADPKPKKKADGGVLGVTFRTRG
jgi:hypothetical protein